MENAAWTSIGTANSSGSASTTICELPDMDVDAVRSRAQEVFAQIKRGNAPLRNSATTSVLIRILERLYKEYAAGICRQDRRDVSIDDMQWRLNTYFANLKARNIASSTQGRLQSPSRTHHH